ncbi:hypothetical protein V6Z11_A10G184700 [Gossypium hirsutum]
MTYPRPDYILSFLHLRGEARLSSVQFSCPFIFHHLHRKSRDSIFQITFYKIGKSSQLGKSHYPETFGRF